MLTTVKTFGRFTIFCPLVFISFDNRKKKSTFGGRRCFLRGAAMFKCHYLCPKVKQNWAIFADFKRANIGWSNQVWNYGECMRSYQPAAASGKAVHLQYRCCARIYSLSSVWNDTSATKRKVPKISTLGHDLGTLSRKRNIHSLTSRPSNECHSNVL